MCVCVTEYVSPVAVETASSGSGMDRWHHIYLTQQWAERENLDRIIFPSKPSDDDGQQQ